MTLVITNEVDRKRIKDCLDEISGSMLQIESHREFIKEAINTICEELQIDKKYFRKMVEFHHKQNINEEVSKFDDVVAMYESIVKNSNES